MPSSSCADSRQAKNSGAPAASFTVHPRPGRSESARAPSQKKALTIGTKGSIALLNSRSASKGGSCRPRRARSKASTVAPANSPGSRSSVPIASKQSLGTSTARSTPGSAAHARSIATSAPSGSSSSTALRGAPSICIARVAAAAVGRSAYAARARSRNAPSMSSTLKDRRKASSFEAVSGYRAAASAIASSGRAGAGLSARISATRAASPIHFRAVYRRRNSGRSSPASSSCER